MYYPYIRGKQFDLIALKELCDIMSRSRNNISPIIEPIKHSSTLKTTIKELARNQINFNIIINPEFGDLKGRSSNIIEIIEEELGSYSNYQIAAIANENMNYLPLLSNSSIAAQGITLIHNHVHDNIDGIIQSHQNVLPVINNAVNFQKTNRRYHRNFDTETVVSLEDFFHTQSKNADYLNIGESFFSEEHLYYSRDGFKGFSDYMTIGDNFSEGGFLPYAVAIHISYAASQNRIRVRHFVSDSNDDTSDVGGKFDEARNKLVEWANENNLSTYAIDQFRQYHKNGHFPGLGTLKKLSIMNHIELVLNLI